MPIVIISSYPPRHCGIGTYAHAQVERLRADGHEVVVISPPDGDGDIRIPFANGRVFREAARRGAGWERIIVHFQPGLYFRPGATAAISKIRTSLGLLSLVRRRPQVEILVHEAHRPTRWRPDHLILRRALARAPLLFHTDAERRAFEVDYRIRARGRLVDHREGVQVLGAGDRQEARRRLGVDPVEPLFLCAGFLHPWKGYERAVWAFSASEGPGRLLIIGSVRDATPENLAYAADLRRLVDRTDGVSLIEEFQSDEDFDAWMTAADRLVLPYTRAWSSGALARPGCSGRRRSCRRSEAWSEQAGPEDEVVESDEQLRAAIERLRAVRPASGMTR